MPNLDSYRTILAGSVVFKGLTAPDLDAVLSAAELLPRKPKDLILSEGSPTDGLYGSSRARSRSSCRSERAAAPIGPVASASTASARDAVSASTA